MKKYGAVQVDLQKVVDDTCKMNYMNGRADLWEEILALLGEFHSKSKDSSYNEFVTSLLTKHKEEM